MNQPEPSAARANVVGFGLQERRLGSTILRTYRQKIDIDDMVPNERQPRLGAKEDEELQRQIEANEGIFEPLLVEPHPDLEGKFRIIDGERRWTNSVKLVEQGRDQYRQIPVEITDRTLTDEERLRVWIYIHRQRKEWDAREKEMVAYRLVDLIGRASAANILGLSIRELQKLVDIYELSSRFRGLRDPAGAITWARELMGVNKKLLTPTVVEAIIEKVAAKRITNSKDLRKLRAILPDTVAREHFLSKQGDIDSAMLRLDTPQRRDKSGLGGDLESVIESMKRVPWTVLSELKGDPVILKRIDEAETLLRSLRKALE
jgi:ParB family chromosome partitioning protein